jgi:hypothetical protein
MVCEGIWTGIGMVFWRLEVRLTSRTLIVDEGTDELSKPGDEESAFRRMSRDALCLS